MPQTSGERPFVAWDGEGVRQFICSSEFVEEHNPYVLFGASTGERIKYVDLSTLDCLRLILRVERKYPRAIHVGFSFGYDVNMICKDLPFRQLVLLKKLGHCRFGGYRLEYIPRKWFIVSKGGVTAKIFDVFLFFNCAFGVALRKYNIGTPSELDRIDQGKAERPNFTFLHIDEIEKYWETELDHLVQLMSQLRSILYKAGLFITSWHGPGALASYALANNGVRDHMDRGLPDSIRSASAFAMFGGRFQGFLAGYYEGKVYDKDINSAYAYAFSRLPSLDGGKWIHVTGDACREYATRVRLGLFRIRFASGYSARPMPLPHRAPNGRVFYPPATIGWYHAPEAAIVSTSPSAEFLEAWIYEDDGTYPFAWIEDAFQERLILQRAGDPTEKGLKWMLAALYGQVAQRAGWERTGGPPRWHQLEWAGAVTSECRAMLYTAAKRAKSSLVSMDTDGFISLAPVNTLPNGIGDGLGQWKATEYSGILYLQNGIYWLRDQDGSWQAPKSRGIPRKKLAFSEVYPLLLQNKNLTVNQHMFIGFGLALQQDITLWRKWIDVPRTVKFGGDGKAAHNPWACNACADGKSWGEAMHPLVQVIPRSIESTAHKLPWITSAPLEEYQVLKMWGIFDE